MSKHYSDEFINSYLDNELENDDREELLNAIRHDRNLSARVCKLKNVKDMVQLAYQIETIPTPNKKSNKHWHSIAASILIIAGVSIGWLAKDFNTQPSLLQLAKTIQIPTNSNSQNKTDWRLMLHVSSYDPKRYNLLLNETEELLKTSSANNKSVQIELLTNSLGLSLLKDDDREFSRKLNKLANKYDNLKLLACETALKRLKVEKGIDLKLISEAQKVKSAIHHLIQRQKEGWSYIHI